MASVNPDLAAFASGSPMNSPPMSQEQQQVPSPSPVTERGNLPNMPPAPNQQANQQANQAVRARMTQRSTAAAQAAAARARATAQTAAAAFYNARDRAQVYSQHPAAQRVQRTAQGHVGKAREYLAQSDSLLFAEKKTGFDRLWLVLGAIFVFTLLVPFNLFGLALPVTTALTFTWPAYKAINALESGSPLDMQNYLTYFVILAYVQTLESLMAGVLTSKINRYYLIKLATMWYMAHPRYRGAAWVYDNIIKSAVNRSRGTPPQPGSANFGSPQSDASYSRVGYDDLSTGDSQPTQSFAAPTQPMVPGGVPASQGQGAMGSLAAKAGHALGLGVGNGVQPRR